MKINMTYIALSVSALFLQEWQMQPLQEPPALK